MSVLRYKVDPTSGCWLWLGPTRGRTPERQYGYVYIGSKTIGAHRASHELFIGPVPPGWEVDHVAERGCTSTLCINPEHLEAVPRVINNERSTRWAESDPAVDQESDGDIEELVLGEDVRICANGHKAERGKACRLCARDRARRQRQRRISTDV